MDNTLICSEVIAKSGVVFGTSGTRGLVTDFTADVCAAFSIGFVKSIKTEFSFNTVALAIDNRPSSYFMAQACAQSLKQLNINVIYYGVIPTPALAYKAMQDSIPSIMVTGSHIPFDRNGLKFYRPDGEITKADEQAILNNKMPFSAVTQVSELDLNTAASEAYIKRYTKLFSADALVGKKVGIYEHSSAGRDLYKSLFEQLGAKVISLGHSENFIPIDTEAVSEEDKKQAIIWSKKYGFDAIFSTDGDGDRPLVADENGGWLRGDLLGLLCSQLLGIEALAVPVSCNTAIEKSNSFKHIIRTKIGSPFVIAEFSQLNENFTRVAGFEANGGFLLGSNIDINAKQLTALPTRDAVLPALMLLIQKQPISMQLKLLPERFTASDRLQNFAKAKSLELIATLKCSADAFLTELGCGLNYSVNTVDGLRIVLQNDDVVHLRASGNAPELRCYTESDTVFNAEKLADKVIQYLNKLK
ncbi:phosphomannomutase [Pseudoalteromonas sp. B62]|uniref:phosphomannomutase n=1 Tax=Pseudoalteromonas sp. B62 TaxID=630483 RepID=UPI00301E0F98